jgi:hypothetical protein
MPNQAYCLFNRLNGRPISAPGGSVAFSAYDISGRFVGRFRSDAGSRRLHGYAGNFLRIIIATPMY